jgi:predicted Zn-dependent protease
LVRLSVFYFILIGLCLSSCQWTPTSYIPKAVDVKVGELIAEQTLSENKETFMDSLQVDSNQATCMAVFKDLTHAALVTNQHNFNWSIHFIKDDSTINAFCVPGGHLFVYTGLMNLCTTKDELAGVIAHEIAHAEKRHSMNQLVQQLGIQVVLESVLGINSFWFGIGTQLVQLKFSRTDELEADEFAYYLLKEKGYKTEALISFFNKMIQANQVHVLEFMSTHPETENRILAIEKLKMKTSN